MRYIQVNIDAKDFSQVEPVGTLGYDMIRGNAASQRRKWNGSYNRFSLVGIRHKNSALRGTFFVRIS